MSHMCRHGPRAVLSLKQRLTFLFANISQQDTFVNSKSIFNATVSENRPSYQDIWYDNICSADF